MFSTILFDIDGTIIDTESVIIASLQEALSQVTGRQYAHNDLRFTLGIPSQEALAQLNLPADQTAAVKALWPKLLATKQRQVTVFATMRRTLAHLQHRGVKLGIITSKSNSELENEFTWFGLNEYFDVIITADAGVAPKPAPDPINLASRSCRCSPRTPCTSAIRYTTCKVPTMPASNSAWQPGAHLICPGSSRPTTC